jgi:beta propeller repeat protein
MKAKLTIVLAVTFAAALATAAFAATAGATQIIANSTHFVTADKIAETNADLSDSNLVWQQKSASGWNIYYADGLAGPGTAICSAAGDQIKPRVSVSGSGGDAHVLVVWEDHRAGNADIYGYDVKTATTFAVCTNAAQQVAPRISGNWVVWQDKRSGSWVIYGARIDTATDTVGPAAPISPEPDSHPRQADPQQTEPDVSGDFVVWVDNRYGDKDILGYDAAADYTFDVCADAAGAVQDQPAVSGDTVVWRDARNAETSGTDIYGYDLRTGHEFPVCQARGDQSSPAVDQDLVVWSDARAATHSLDVRGYDLTLQQAFPVAVTTAWQGQPTVSDYQVVWTDGRNGGVNDLWAAVLTPWNASLKIDGGAAWTKSSTASLALFAQGKTGEVTRMTLSNVDPTAPAGTAEPYSEFKSPWYLTTGDGLKTVSVTFTDRSGASSPTLYDSITVDTHGPTIKVPAIASVTSGAVASIGYRVTDRAPRATVTIRLLDQKGNVVRVFPVGKVSTGNVLHHLKFTCTLKAGSYKVRVGATDLAGNHQAKLGANTLTVT